MNSESIGHVTVNERVPSLRFHKFVDERMQGWMREHLNGSNFGSHTDREVSIEASASEIAFNETDYEVSFFDEDPLGEISCLVVVQSGETLWRAWESADNPRAALSRSLEHLHTSDVDENGNNGDDRMT